MVFVSLALGSAALFDQPRPIDASFQPEGPARRLPVRILVESNWVPGDRTDKSGSDRGNPVSCAAHASGSGYHFQPNRIIRRMHEILLRPQIPFRRLNGCVPEEHLNLLQLAAACSA